MGIEKLGFTVLIVVALLLLLGAFLIIKRQQGLIRYLLAEQKKQKKEVVRWEEGDEEQLRIIRRRMEYTALQSQINPHFLYNTLESIRSRALQDDNTEIASMTEILAKFFRYCIGNGERLIKIREEVNHIDNYYYIQKYRFEERMKMEVIVEDDELYELYVPKMSLQPLVENAMIHGLESEIREGRIIIRISRTQKKVVISVEDNGSGMSVDQLRRLNDKLKSPYVNANVQKGNRNGIALVNVNARLRLSFGKEYGIHYHSIEGAGTQAIMTIPQIDEFARVKYKDILHFEG
ncbi:sensor histidine kinase YesM [Lachnospiraceae bacterium PM6-15]|uniref:sensor histidine kinase n=1 Tax=Ohessyouella blattaphilus TaxID=2949333 RepID=UPI003E1C294A